MCYASGGVESMNGSLLVMQEASGTAKFIYSPQKSYYYDTFTRRTQLIL